MTLESIISFGIPQVIIDETERSLVQAGDDGYEQFVLWTGTPCGDTFRVEHIYVPEQTSFRLDDGLCVRVDDVALDRLNRWLYEKHQVLAIQVHTHSGDAYHSRTDDTYPIVTLLGGLSIVAAQFCRQGLVSEGTAVYRLDRHRWVLQDRQQVAALLRVNP
jgi:hypothetical protein